MLILLKQMNLIDFKMDKFILFVQIRFYFNMEKLRTLVLNTP